MNKSEEILFKMIIQSDVHVKLALFDILSLVPPFFSQFILIFSEYFRTQWVDAQESAVSYSKISLNASALYYQSPIASGR